MNNPDMNQIRYRNMIPADHADIMAVHRGAYIHAYTNVTPDVTLEAIQFHVSGDWADSHIASRERRVESGRSLVRVAELGGVVIGFCEASHAAISALYVYPYRGRGIGSKLLAAGLDFARSTNDDVMLTVVPNIPAEDFYKKHGFQPTGRDLSASYPRLRGGQVLPQAEFVLPADS